MSIARKDKRDFLKQINFKVKHYDDMIRSQFIRYRNHTLDRFWLLAMCCASMTVDDVEEVMKPYIIKNIDIKIKEYLKQDTDNNGIYTDKRIKITSFDTICERHLLELDGYHFYKGSKTDDFVVSYTDGVMEDDIFYYNVDILYIYYALSLSEENISDFGLDYMKSLGAYCDVLAKIYSLYNYKNIKLNGEKEFKNYVRVLLSRCDDTTSSLMYFMSRILIADLNKVNFNDLDDYIKEVFSEETISIVIDALKFSPHNIVNNISNRVSGRVSSIADNDMAEKLARDLVLACSSACMYNNDLVCEKIISIYNLYLNENRYNSNDNNYQKMYSNAEKYNKDSRKEIKKLSEIIDSLTNETRTLKREVDRLNTTIKDNSEVKEIKKEKQVLIKENKRLSKDYEKFKSRNSSLNDKTVEYEKEIETLKNLLKEKDSKIEIYSNLLSNNDNIGEFISIEECVNKLKNKRIIIVGGLVGIRDRLNQLDLDIELIPIDDIGREVNVSGYDIVAIYYKAIKHSDVWNVQKQIRDNIKLTYISSSNTNNIIKELSECL